MDTMVLLEVMTGLTLLAMSYILDYFSKDK